jgi:hypothetical protein
MGGYACLTFFGVEFDDVDVGYRNLRKATFQTERQIVGVCKPMYLEAKGHMNP